MAFRLPGTIPTLGGIPGLIVSKLDRTAGQRIISSRPGSLGIRLGMDVLAVWLRF